MELSAIQILVGIGVIALLMGCIVSAPGMKREEVPDESECLECGAAITGGQGLCRLCRQILFGSGDH